MRWVSWLTHTAGNDTDDLSYSICNNWYHIECVGLDPLLVPLVNVFICPECDKGKLSLRSVRQGYRH